MQGEERLNCGGWQNIKMNDLAQGLKVDKNQQGRSITMLQWAIRA